MIKQTQCDKCNNYFANRGGCYNRHYKACNGVYRSPNDKGLCLHCEQQFDLDDQPKGWMANHSRWCKKNPMRDEYITRRNLHMMTPQARIKANQGVSDAHKRGAYAHVDYSKINSGRKHTEETKEKMRQSALASPHRRRYKIQIPFIDSFGDNVMLDSSWELALAKRLNELSIMWIRPEPIPWFDELQYRHNYFSDFYLTEYDLYLDPKNDFVYGEQIKKITVLNKTYSNIMWIRSLKECEEFTLPVKMPV